MKTVKATKPHRYAQIMRNVGDEYQAADKHATLFVKLGKAEYVTDSQPEKPKPKPKAAAKKAPAKNTYQTKRLQAEDE